MVNIMLEQNENLQDGYERNSLSHNRYELITRNPLYLTNNIEGLVRLGGSSPEVLSMAAECYNIIKKTKLYFEVIK